MTVTPLSSRTAPLHSAVPALVVLRRSSCLVRNVHRNRDQVSIGGGSDGPIFCLG